MTFVSHDGALLDEHAIAVREEAVALADGVLVGGEDAVASGEGGDEHEERRLRQVEVGEQRAHDAEVEARVNKDVGFAGAGDEPTRVLSGDKLKGADGGSADGDDATLRSE